MAAESPIRIVEASGKWAARKDSVVLAPSCAVTAEEMTFLLNGHRFHGSGKGAAPNRSGSAPPSMEGSLAVIENLMPRKSFKVDSSSKSLNSSIDKCGVDPLHDDQSFPVYNSSSAILNSRLHPRLRSQEDQHLVHQVEGFGNKRRSYLDDDGNGSFHLLSHGILSAHKEESKDDQSPGQQSDDLPDKSSRFLSGQKGTVGQKNFDGLMQVSRQSLSLSYASAEEAAHSDAGPSCLQDISVRISNAATHGGAMDGKGLSFTCDPSTAQLSTSSHLNFLTGALPLLPLPSSKSNRSEVHFTTEASVSDTDYSSTANIESEMKVLNISGFQKMENPKCQKERNHICENNLQYHPAYQHQISMCQVQGVNNQLVSQGKNQACLGLGQYQHGPSKFLADAQPVFHSFGFMPPLYPTAAAFMTPTNPFCPSIVPIPPLTLGAYALNTTNCSSFIAGYPSPSDIHLPYDDTAGQGFNAGTSAVSSGGSFAHGVDMQQLNKSCGQWGLAFEPSFVDPLQTQYFQHPLWNAYSIPGQVVLQGSRGDAYRSQMSGTDAQKCYDVAAYSDEWMFQNQKIGGLGILNPRSGIMGLNFFGCPTNISMMMQLSSSSLPTPVLPGSSVDGISLSGRNNDLSFSSASGRNMGTCGARDGWKGYKSFDYPKANSFLEELKSGKGRTLELCDIVGHVVEFSADQHGSRFIQQKLEICSAEEKAFVFKEVLPHTSKLMTDVFGNYVIQKYLEYGSAEQREELAMEFAGQVLPLSLQMYGCRVIQKALEVIDVEQMTKLVCELDGHVLRCVRDQNGNHVIQKCIECIPVGNIQFVIAAFRGQVAILSTHPYGCRVIQRILEYCMDDLQSQFIVDEILQSAYTLAHDQYGNYVTQHVLEKGKPYERSQIIRKLSGHFVHLSQHKFASNVVEKCLEHGDTFEQELLIQEIIGHDEGNDKLLAMMKDQFANYVVQKILAKCTDAQRDTLLNRIKVHAQSLKKYTYGKHIIARLEQFELFGEAV